MEQLDTHLEQLKIKQESLEEEVKNKRSELERAEKRLESIQNVKPTHLNETAHLEQELAFIYKAYVERIRNHDYLQQQLETYHELEEQYNEYREKQMEGIRNDIIMYNKKILNDENEDLNGEEDEMEEDDGQDVGDERGGMNNFEGENEGDEMELNGENEVYIVF